MVNPEERGRVIPFRRDAAAWTPGIPWYDRWIETLMRVPDWVVLVLCVAAAVTLGLLAGELVRF